MTNQNFSNPLRIGLTGASGVLGQTIQAIWPEVEWLKFAGDLRSFSEVETWYQSLGNIQGIIHFGALVPTHLVEAEPLGAMRTNVLGTCHILEAIRADALKSSKSLPWFFLASTSHVYRSSDLPLREDSALDPISLYGMTKLQGEEWGQVYLKKYQLPICTGRIFSYSSHLQPSSYFIPSTIRKISQATIGAKLEIPGLHGTRDFLTAEEVCFGVKKLFHQRARGIFNIASGTPQKLLDIVKTIQHRLNRSDIEIIATSIGTNHLVANVDQLNQLGIKLQFNLNQLLDVLLNP